MSNLQVRTIPQTLQCNDALLCKYILRHLLNHYFYLPCKIYEHTRCVCLWLVYIYNFIWMEYLDRELISRYITLVTYMSNQIWYTYKYILCLGLNIVAISSMGVVRICKLAKFVEPLLNFILLNRVLKLETW